MLIVEDQAPMRAALREFMQAAYPQEAILEAADGAQALELCRSHRPRLVLMDLGLPDASGIELIPRVKALVPGCVVIVVSQHAERAYAERARAAGAFAYVSKGAIYSELLPAVADGLSGAPAGGARLSDGPATLHILLVEDSEEDAELVMHTLRKEGIEAQFERVQSAAALLTALGGQAWDAVIADFRLPGFSGLDALGMVRAAGLDVPFILVSGTIGEKAVVEVMKAGADDFVTKENLARLAPALKRALRDLTERRRTAEALRANEERYRAMFENAGVGITRSEIDGRFIEVNPKFCDITGYTREQALELGFQDLAHPDSVQQGIEFRTRLVAGTSAPQEREVRVLRRDGAQIWVNVTTALVRDAAGKPLHFVSVLHDVTERMVQRERINRLNRVHSVLSGINALIVRVRTREELFQGACRIAVEAGKFRLAWAGIVDRTAMRVAPVAWQGGGEDYIELMPVGLGGAGAGDRGLPGQAVEERKAMISNDMTQDPRVRLRKEAQERGFRSLAVLPLLIGEEAVGVLALYAGEAGFFDAEEVKLLDELAGDIAFALKHLDALGKVEFLAFHDPLTGLPNRAVLTDRLEQMLRAARREKLHAGVVFFDVERFSLVNDTLGRRAGDELLKQIAERLKSATRAQDTVARMGGDVFAMAVAGFPHVVDATHLFTDRMTQAFAQPIVVDGRELRAVLKAGVAVFPTDGDSAETLCTNAEAALKKAKDAGERHLFYTPEMNARVAESLALETRLRRALEEEQFVLHYQPKVAVATRALVGLEALIRWNDPELGLVPPARFIPLMEETGIILHAGRWALRRAVADVQRWRARGLKVPRVAVNVSPIQLRQKDFVKTVLGALEGFGDDEPLLDLEITEGVIMEDVESTIKMLQMLRGVGVETYIDDFGTGYCSLAYVAKLPVAALKIDRSFVIEMAASQYARTIVEMVVSLAHTLQLKVVAEGVDQEEQVEILRSLGCDQMQGFLVSRPVPAGQIESLLARA